jgi:hypothetical protein
MRLWAEKRTYKTLASSRNKFRRCVTRKSQNRAIPSPVEADVAKRGKSPWTACASAVTASREKGT